MKRFSVCAAGLFAVVLVAQPALGQWRAVGSSGNSGSSNPEDWTMAVVSPDDENLYAIDISNGSTTFVRGLRNNVDADLAAGGWTAPFWGESYRDGQHVAYNPDNGLLYHRNGTRGYRDAVLDPRSYDTRLIETYDPGTSANFFTAAPVKVYNSLLDRIGGPVNDRLDPDHIIDGSIFTESRSFTYDDERNYFLLANNDGNVGYWDPTLTAAMSSVHVGTGLGSYRGLAWYDTNLDGGTTANRVFTGVNDNGGGYSGDSFFELDNTLGGTYLTDLSGGVPAGISLTGAPGTVDQSIGGAQHPGTGDLYAIVTLSTGGRHLIRYDAADVDAFNPLTDFFISATYLGPTGVDITAITFVPDVTPANDADFNGDGWVDGLDYLIWAGNFGTHPGPDGDNSDGDFNDDGWIDGLDYLGWAGQFGSHSSSAVPEPGTFALAGLALLGLLVSRRRR